jgi:hypothetical protein
MPTGEEWIEQAAGKMGLLHPGTWIAPSLVMMFGPPGLVALGMIIFPIALIMTLMRMRKPHPERRYPATFTTPAVVMMLLVLWIVSALVADAPRGGPVPVPAPSAPASDDAGVPATGWQVRLSEPTVTWGWGTPRMLRLAKVPEVERAIAASYAGVPDGSEKVVRLRVWVRRDGSVHPERVETEGATDVRLEEAVLVVAPGMRFVYLDDLWMPAEGEVELGVLYAPPSSR